MQRLVDVLDSVAEGGQRLRVIRVGGAAMTLPRYVAATRPSSAQIVLEPDIELTAFVRRYLASRPAAGSRYPARTAATASHSRATGTPTSPASWPPLDPKTLLTPCLALPRSPRRKPSWPRSELARCDPRALAS